MRNVNSSELVADHLNPECAERLINAKRTVLRVQTGKLTPSAGK